MYFIYTIILISLVSLPAFAGITNDVVHQEFLRSEKITKNAKDCKSNLEFKGYKKIAAQSISDYEPIIRSLKKQHVQKLQEIQKTQNTKYKGLIKPAPRAVIFVSFSMPDLSLKQIIEDATKYNIPVVIRGLIDNSFQKTVTRVFELVKEDNKGGVLINPMWFKQYAINAVPACIVKQGDNFDVIYGNLRLEKMLEIIATSGTVGVVAQDILNKGRI